MKKFDLPHLLMIHRKIAMTVEFLKSSPGDKLPVNELEPQKILDLLKEIQDYCFHIRFKHAGQKAYTVHTVITKNPSRVTGLELAGRFISLREDLEICMFSHQFVQVEEEVVKYLSPASQFGGKSLMHFPTSL